MANNSVWFGTKEHMRWIPAPAVDVQASKAGYQAQASFISGGAWVRRSKASAKTYSMSWNMRNFGDVRPVLDYADGVYGNGHIYYVDPFIMTNNVLPSYWATPALNYYDGPVIVNDTRPVLINNNASVNGYPVESAQYTVTSTGKRPSIFLPIPEDHTIYIGAHGSLQSGNASVTVTPVISAIANGTTTNLSLLSKTTTSRTNYTLSNSSGYIGVTLSFGSTSTGVVQLDGLIARIYPDGALPSSGGFISGQGSSGLSFVSQPSVSQYSAALDRVGVSVDLIETEAWTWQ